MPDHDTDGAVRVSRYSGTVQGWAGVSVAAFVVLWAGVCGFGFDLYRDSLANARMADATQVLATLDGSLSNALNQRLALVRGLAAHVTALVAVHHDDPATLAQDFAAFAQALSADRYGLLNLSVAPGGIVQQVYPMTDVNRRVLGNDLTADPRPAFQETMRRARDTGDVVLHGPIPLIQGPEGLIARMAVYDRGKLWGFVGVVIDLDAILASSGLTKVPPGLDVAVRSSNGETFFGRPGLFDEQSVSVAVTLPGDPWQLALAPKDGWRRVPVATEVLFGAVGLLVGGLAAAILWLKISETGRLHQTVRARTDQLSLAYSQSNARAEELASANKDLELSAIVFANSEEGILISDSRNRVISVNSAFERMSGYSAVEVIGQDPKLLSSGRHGKAFYRALWADLLRDDTWSGELWNRRKSGDVFPEWIKISVVRDGLGQISNFIAIVSDMTAKKAAEARIVQLAFHDPLTGLANRALMLDRLGHAIARAQRAKSPIGLMFVDLDRFKLINDTLGHAVGDAVLMVVAERITENVRAHDTVARIGGDEFVVIVTETVGDGCMRIADAIRTSIAKPIMLEGHEVQTTCSIGIAFHPEDGQSIADLMRAADTALYTAKDGGRDRVEIFTSDVGQRLLTRKSIEDGLRLAVERGDFVVHYQPQIDLKTGAVAGVEALVRWQRRPDELVPPTVFIAIAEETGLINRLGEWVLRQAVALRQTLMAQGFGGIEVAVNLSAVQLRHGALPETIDAVLADTGADPAGIEFEITESVLLEDRERSASQLTHLRRRGFTIAIDDFGTGYSSLAYLKQFGVDYIKIDRSFVTGVDGGSAVDRGIVTAINAMAHSMGAKTIAEGIETEGELRFLTDIGCDYVQGFYLARPMDQDRLLAWLRQRDPGTNQY